MQKERSFSLSQHDKTNYTNERINRLPSQLENMFSAIQTIDEKKRNTEIEKTAATVYRHHQYTRMKNE